MIAEKTEELLDWAELVAIGRVAKAQGRLGEVILNPLTDFPERFRGLSRVLIEGPDGGPIALAIAGSRTHKGRPVLKFVGVSNISEAEALAGKEIRIPDSELSPLHEKYFYHFDIVGLRVEDPRRGFLGLVEDIVTTGGADVLVVRRPEGGELLLPLCAEICRRIDRDAGVIAVETPEGLVELNED